MFFFWRMLSWSISSTKKAEKMAVFTCWINSSLERLSIVSAMKLLHFTSMGHHFKRQKPLFARTSYKNIDKRFCHFSILDSLVLTLSFDTAARSSLPTAKKAVYVHYQLFTNNIYVNRAEQAYFDCLLNFSIKFGINWVMRCWISCWRNICQSLPTIYPMDNRQGWSKIINYKFQYYPVN